MKPTLIAVIVMHCIDIIAWAANKTEQLIIKYKERKRKKVDDIDEFTVLN